MAKFRKKPIQIEAVKWTGENLTELLVELVRAVLPEDAKWHPGEDGVLIAGPFILDSQAPRNLVIPTLEGDMTAKPGDWVIRGINGELYPLKPDIFEATYEAVG